MGVALVSGMASLAGCNGPLGMHPQGAPCPFDAQPFVAPDALPPDVACDGDRPPVVDAGVFAGATAVVIGGDGTMYYTQTFAVGRWVHGMPEEDRWAEFANGTMLTALALRPATHQLFVAAPSDHAIYAIDLTQANPRPTVFVHDAGLPNGLTLSPCGDLFFTDLSQGNIFWVDASGNAAQVNTMGGVSQPAGLAFGPDGALYVTSVGEGAVKRLELAANVEQSRTTVLSSTSMTNNADAGVGAPHGIAFDMLGRMYLTDDSRRSLLRFNFDGSHGTSVLGNLTLGGGMDFGAGPLDCGDLYIANSGTLQRYQGGNTPGADVPWHH
jgi:sugar lactone lactonase YvrE